MANSYMIHSVDLLVGDHQWSVSASLRQSRLQRLAQVHGIRSASGRLRQADVVHYRLHRDIATGKILSFVVLDHATINRDKVYRMALRILFNRQGWPGAAG